MQKLIPPVNEIMGRYKLGISPSAIARETGCYVRRVRDVIRLNGGLRPMSEQCSKYTLNRHFFDYIDCEDKAYWFGFLCADGHVRVARRKNGHVDKRVVLKLQRQDEPHIFAFRGSIGSGHPVKRDVSTVSSRISINSADLASGLINNGILKYKNGGEWPKIDTNLEHHFIRGLIDGDGWVSLNAHGDIVIGFCSQFKEPVDRMLEAMGIDVSVHWRKGVWRWDKNSIDGCTAIGDYLYSDATVWLDRKRCNYNKWLCSLAA